MNPIRKREYTLRELKDLILDVGEDVRLLVDVIKDAYLAEEMPLVKELLQEIIDDKTEVYLRPLAKCILEKLE